MVSGANFINDIGLPEELVPLLVHERWTIVVEYASIKRDGTPVTAPLVAYPGEAKRTIAISTGLAYPSKAERARRNPKVCLLYSEPKTLPKENPPVILVYGHATIRDNDLQANLDRVVRETMARSESFRNTPSFILRWMTGYLARIWIEVTPLRILWWPDADTEKVPQEWRAPEGTFAPPSDPPPEPLTISQRPLVTPSANWQKGIAYAFDKLGIPVLTVVDEAGYPVPFRVRSSSLKTNGAHLELPSAMPAEPKGRACLTFHAVTVKDGQQVSNENMSFLGDLSKDGEGVLFSVERQLPSFSAKLDSLKGYLNYFAIIRRTAKRAKVEAARRGQPVPSLRLPE